MRDIILGQGAEPVGDTPDEMQAAIRAEFTQWARIIKLSGAKVD